MVQQKNISSDFIKFGTFNPAQGEILKKELNEQGIPVKVLYPSTNVGRETSGGAAWIAYTVMIPEKDINKALSICKTLNIFPVRKVSFLPPVFHTGINRYLLGVTLLILISFWLWAAIGDRLSSEEVFVISAFIIVGVLGLNFVIAGLRALIKTFKNEKYN